LISFSFKREAKLYVVFKEEKYTLDFSSLDFSQTFEEYSYSNKTLQIKNMFEQSVINKANPANFEITFPAIREPDLQILFNRALDYQTFDLYAVVGPNVFLIETCVIANLNFVIERLKPVSMVITGEATKVSLFGRSDEVDVPGTPVSRSSTRSYNRVQYVKVILNSKLSESIKSINAELQTQVNWTPYTNVSDAIDALDGGSIMYPKEFTVRKRDLIGSFNSYFIEKPNWATNTSVYIQAGEQVGSVIAGFEFDIKEASFTSTVITGEIFTHKYDWKMTQNPESLAEVIKYIGYTNVAAAIQDNLDFDILDYVDSPILESL
jgi:hypothetical protein